MSDLAAVPVAAGVDTWSPCWYVDRDSMAGQWLTERASAPCVVGKLVPEPVGGHRIGWDGGIGMLYAEGHPAAALGRTGLLQPGHLPDAYVELVTAMQEASIPVPPGDRAGVLMDSENVLLGHRSDGFAGVRRLDATVDLETRSGAEGLALLAGVAALVRDSPGKSDIWYGDDRGVETVYLLGRAGRKILGRWYDKGLESGLAARGRLIRPEDQRRFTKDSRRGVDELLGGYVRERFQRRFYDLWRSSEGVTVAGPMILADKLREAVEADELTPRQAHQLAGYLLLGDTGLSRTTGYRRRLDLKGLGLVLGDGVLQEVEVDLHGVLEACMDSGAWGHEG